MGTREARWRAVARFAANVLREGRDRFGPEPTPLFADGLDLADRSPVVWAYRGSAHPAGEWVVSNLALQQNLLRTLVGFSALSGEAPHHEAAAAAVAWHCDHLASPCGLLRWGGHQFVDLRGKTPQGPCMGDVHEFKHTYPFYEFLAAVRPAAAARFVRAFWNAHILDFSTLDMSRHGEYGRPMGALWDSPFATPAPFREGLGLSFINCGSDLILAAALQHRLAGEPGALLWARRLDALYVQARHPVTGLGVYQYSSPRARRQPAPGCRSTLSIYGDRARRQLGPEFGEAALEGNVLDGRRAESIYGHHALIQLQLAAELGRDGAAFGAAALSGLRACARWLYTPASNTLRPMLADGTDLTGRAPARDGYYGPAGRVWRPRPAGPLLLRAFVLGHHHSGDPDLWAVARSIAAGNGLGDIGVAPGVGVRPAPAPPADPLALFAVLDLYGTVPVPAYLALAEAIGDRLLAERWQSDHGYFLPRPDARHARFDAVEPLALLALEATLRGQAELVPTYRGGSGFLQGLVDDGPRVTDEQLFWGVRGGVAGAPA